MDARLQKVVMKKSCCVCLNEVDELADAVHACEICKDTHVCAICFDVMRQTNIHGKCPVCRCEHWSSGSDEVLIITDADPFAERRERVSIDILLNSATRFNNITRHTMVAKLAIKLIITLAVIWSFGFIVLSLIQNDFYQGSIFYVIFGSICIGIIVSAVGVHINILLSDTIFCKCICWRENVTN